MMILFRKIRYQLLNIAQFKTHTIYAIVEVVLIIIGILFALQIERWNQNNKELAEERLVLTRLNNELSSNLDNVENLRKGFQNKEESLKNIALIYKSKTVQNDSAFLSNVIVSSSYGWTVQPLSQSTYDEIINTGKLGIIRNIELRSSISQLYNSYKLYERVGMERTSDYSKEVYGIIPMETDLNLKQNLSEKEQKEMVSAIKKLNIEKFIIYEQNRIRLIQKMYDGIENSINQLKIKIEAELED